MNGVGFPHDPVQTVQKERVFGFGISGSGSFNIRGLFFARHEWNSMNLRAVQRRARNIIKVAEFVSRQHTLAGHMGRKFSKRVGRVRGRAVPRLLSGSGWLVKSWWLFAAHTTAVSG